MKDDKIIYEYFITTWLLLLLRRIFYYYSRPFVWRFVWNLAWNAILREILDCLLDCFPCYFTGERYIFRRDNFGIFEWNLSRRNSSKCCHGVVDYIYIYLRAIIEIILGIKVGERCKL